VSGRSIYLIGFSGTGKSTVARLLAARLGWPATDLDQRIAEEAGASIPQIFAHEGEAHFRERETQALRRVAEHGPVVVATGGGAPLREENRALMAASGWMIALEARPETVHARIQRQLHQAAPDAVRPLLDADDPLDRLRALKERRQPVYALADWTIHTDRLSAEQVADEIMRAVALLEQAAALEKPGDGRASDPHAAP
jgi:shikimate kinase